MLLKRFLVLAAGVLLFVFAFIAYFQFSHTQMENRFRDKRKAFGVEGMTLTSTTPAAPAVAPLPGPSFETNALIGPVPPAAPDTNAAPAPADTSLPTPPAPSTDSNAVPVAPASSSTMVEPETPSSSVFQMTAYRPFAGAEVHIVTAATGQTTTDSATPATTTAPAPAKLVAPAPAAEMPGSSTGSVIVLLYHQFRPAGTVINPKYLWTMHQDVFESEMKYIHDNGYNVIPMSDLLKFIKHEGTVPPRAVVITIDDGYKSAIVYAAPILKKYNYPWTFFIYPDFVTVAEGNGAASWNDLLELQKEGIDIESHSMTHPKLTSHRQKWNGSVHNLTPDEYAAWLENETAGSKRLLEEKMGKKIISFAYPYGLYNKQVEDAAIAAGYEAIFTVADNPVHATTSLHSIGRYTMTTPVEKNFAAYLRQGALGLTSADPAPGATTNDPRPVITAVLGYPGKLDPKSLETSVRDFGIVRHDFDPQTNTIRLYLPRDLVAPVVLVNIRVADAATGQIMVANWHFNYEPTGGAISAHPPTTEEPAPKPVVPATVTNAPAAVEPELEKNATGTPLDKQAEPTTPAHVSAPAPTATPAPGKTD